jgi:hypothetical protein
MVLGTYFLKACQKISKLRWQNTEHNTSASASGYVHSVWGEYEGWESSTLALYVMCKKVQ